MQRRPASGPNFVLFFCVFFPFLFSFCLLLCLSFYSISLSLISMHGVWCLYRELISCFSRKTYYPVPMMNVVYAILAGIHKDADSPLLEDVNLHAIDATFLLSLLPTDGILLPYEDFQYQTFLQFCEDLKTIGCTDAEIREFNRILIGALVSGTSPTQRRGDKETKEKEEGQSPRSDVWTTNRASFSLSLCRLRFFPVCPSSTLGRSSFTFVCGQMSSSTGVFGSLVSLGDRERRRGAVKIPLSSPSSFLLGTPPSLVACTPSNAFAVSSFFEQSLRVYPPSSRGVPHSYVCTYRGAVYVRIHACTYTKMRGSMGGWRRTSVRLYSEAWRTFFVSQQQVRVSSSGDEAYRPWGCALSFLLRGFCPLSSFLSNCFY